MSPTRRHRAPGGDPAAPRDQPDTAVGRGVRRIAERGFGQTGRMRMIMADHARPPGPRRPVRGDQRDRIDLEPVPGLGATLAQGCAPSMRSPSPSSSPHTSVSGDAAAAARMKSSVSLEIVTVMPKWGSLWTGGFHHRCADRAHSGRLAVGPRAGRCGADPVARAAEGPHQQRRGDPRRCDGPRPRQAGDRRRPVPGRGACPPARA